MSRPGPGRAPSQPAPSRPGPSGRSDAPRDRLPRDDASGKRMTSRERRNRWDPLMLARWQFGITTVYHFMFVPLTIGLVARRFGDANRVVPDGEREVASATQVLGPVVRHQLRGRRGDRDRPGVPVRDELGRVPRHVGDVFGAPLAMEALAAFFLESTFLGLWIFGWDRLSKKIHLATIWALAIGTNLSAYFIIAANSWMQHPVGAELNPETVLRRDDRHRRRAHQQHRADHVPAHDRRRVHDDRRLHHGIALYRLVRGRGDPDAESRSARPPGPGRRCSSSRACSLPSPGTSRARS